TSTTKGVRACSTALEASSETASSSAARSTPAASDAPVANFRAARTELESGAKVRLAPSTLAVIIGDRPGIRASCPRREPSREGIHRRDARATFQQPPQLAE